MTTPSTYPENVSIKQENSDMTTETLSAEDVARGIFSECITAGNTWLNDEAARIITAFGQQQFELGRASVTALPEVWLKKRAEKHIEDANNLPSGTDYACMMARAEECFEILDLISKGRSEKENPDEYLSKKIEEIDWPKLTKARILNVLAAEGVETIGDLIKWSDKELSLIPNFGNKSRIAIKDYLKTIGLGLSRAKEWRQWNPKTKEMMPWPPKED